MGGALTSAAPVLAQDFTVGSGQTVGSQAMTGAGDTGRIETGGTINSGATGVEMRGADQTLDNGGAINVTGASSYGVDSDGANSLVKNSGSVLMTGDFSIGILSAGANSRVDTSGTVTTTGRFSGGISARSVINTGVITTTGIVSNGIYSFGANATSINRGSIVTSGTNSVGMYSDGAEAAVVNYGTITTTGNSSDGIRTFQDGAGAINFGTITTSGRDAHGILAVDASTRIENRGTIKTTGQLGNGMTSQGDNNQIINGGTISTAGNSGVGISSSGANANIRNSHTISTTGDFSVGIFSEGANDIIRNSGKIDTTGMEAYGIVANGPGAQITNSGVVFTTSMLADAIVSDEADARIDNRGAIITIGLLASGIRSEGAGAEIANSSVIVTSGMQAHAVYTTGDDVRITNSGTIATTGSRAQGIVSTGAGARIDNSGAIVVSGSQALAILSSGADSQVTNSGRIFSDQFTAITFFGAQDNVLTLKTGSVIGGAITFGGGADTLVVDRGISLVYTFDKAPETLGAGGAPVAVSGARVAVLDPTTLAAEDVAFADLTGGISSAVTGRLSGLRHTDGAKPHRDAWIQGFGGFREPTGGGAATETDSRVAGVVSGMDVPVSASARAGFFLGGSGGEIANGSNTQKTTIDSVFGGAYASTAFGSTAFDFVFTAGYSDYDRERQVGNNLAVGGIEQATAGYGGMFISPELTITQPVSPFGIRLEQVLTLRYAGLFLDGFSERGAADGFSTDDRDIHLGVVRAALALPFESRSADGAYGRLTLSGGIEGRAQFGDGDFSGILLGQAIAFDTGSDDSAVAGFVGARGEHTTADGLTAFISFEGKVEDTGSHFASAYGGLMWRF